MTPVSGPATFVLAGTRYGSLDLEEGLLGDRPVKLERCWGADPNELREAARGASVILAGSAARVTAQVLEVPGLRGVVRYGIGVDNVDLRRAAELNLAVANVPDYCVDEVSTHTVCLILALGRKLLASTAHLKAGGWGIAALRPMHAPRVETVGIVGLGRIGREVARKLGPFGFTLLGHDPNVSPNALHGTGIRWEPLDDLLAASDYVTLHMPLTEGTRHLIGERALSRMKAGSALVNTSRGGLVDEAALSRAMDAGQIGAAALDVLEEEPPGPGRPILSQENALLTPHTAWYTLEAERELRKKGLEEALRIIDRRPLANPVRV